MNLVPPGLVASFPEDTEIRLKRYLNLLLDWNTRVNLISRQEKAPWIHFQDSLHFAFWPKQGQSVMDIGTGAGFPGLVTAVARPDLSVTLVEPNRKKQVFLNAVVAELGLRVTLLDARVERGVLVGCRQKLDIRQHWDHAVCKALAAPQEFVRMTGDLAPTLWFFASREQMGNAVPKDVPSDRRKLSWTVADSWTVESDPASGPRLRYLLRRP